MLNLEELTAGAQVVGIEPVGPVTLVAVEPVGADAVTVGYRTGEGAIAERMLFRTDPVRRWLRALGDARAIDVVGSSVKHVSEAQRTRLASLLDSMMAVHISNVGP